jgi:hypothetical protein
MPLAEERVCSLRTVEEQEPSRLKYIQQRPTDLENVCLLEVLLPENCHLTLSVWKPPLKLLMHLNKMG